MLSYRGFRKRPVLALRGKYPYSEFFWSVFSHIWTKYGEIPSISSYSVWMWEIMDQKNCEYGHFPRSGELGWLSHHNVFITANLFSKNLAFNLELFTGLIQISYNAKLVDAHHDHFSKLLHFWLNIIISLIS